MNWIRRFQQYNNKKYTLWTCETYNKYRSLELCENHPKCKIRPTTINSRKSLEITRFPWNWMFRPTLSFLFVCYSISTKRTQSQTRIMFPCTIEEWEKNMLYEWLVTTHSLTTFSSVPFLRLLRFTLYSKWPKETMKLRHNEIELLCLQQIYVSFDEHHNIRARWNLAFAKG